MRLPILCVSFIFALVQPGIAADLRFAIIGDRTGGAQLGVYSQVWKEIAARQPAFVVATGDTIEGLGDASAPSEWRELERMLQPYKRYAFYTVPGNHDIWSAASERLFRQHTAKPLNYSFDYGGAHFTMLDNSRSESFPPESLAFLEKDLKAHADQPVKFVFSHRPSWIINVAVKNPDFAFHQLVRRYGVQYVIAGHVHQLLHFNLQGVTYLSMPSSGAHLRASGEYADGWFFGYALVEVSGSKAQFDIHEVEPPHGRGRSTRLTDWGMLGLLDRRQQKMAPAK